MSGGGGRGGSGQNLGNNWSKSIVLENKVFLNFDFRNGAKIRSPPIAKLWSIIYKLDYVWPLGGMGGGDTGNPPEIVLSENVIF